MMAEYHHVDLDSLRVQSLGHIDLNALLLSSEPLIFGVCGPCFRVLCHLPVPSSRGWMNASI